MANEALNFIAVKENGRETSFLFTTTAIEVLRGSYFVSNEDIAEELRARIINDIIEPEHLNIQFIDKIISEAEDEVLCEQFLSEKFPRFSIESYEIISYNDQTEIETTITHCKQNSQCIECLKKMALV